LSSSIPKELLPQPETEEDLEQILADAGEGDTTDGTTDISETDTDFNIPSAEAFQSTSSLVTTEIAPNSEETPVVQILNPSNYLYNFLPICNCSNQRNSLYEYKLILIKKKTH
jgi:hypothetical protein